jgi:transposase InsO family protein
MVATTPGTCEAKPLRKANSKSLATFFWENIFCRYGAPQKVITDNGPEVQDAFDKLLKRLEIPQIRITPYNHHANGVVERGHFILRESIIKACKSKINDWPDKVQEAVFADRVTISRVTGFSPISTSPRYRSTSALRFGRSHILSQKPMCRDDHYRIISMAYATTK